MICEGRGWVSCLNLSTVIYKKLHIPNFDHILWSLLINSRREKYMSLCTANFYCHMQKVHPISLLFSLELLY